MSDVLIVCGGAGFIGSNFVRHVLARSADSVVTVDKLTYAGHRENLEGLDPSRHELVVGDICDLGLMQSLFERFSPRALVNFAAETHVDRSIADPDSFVETNVVGTLRLLRLATAFCRGLPETSALRFRFVQVSTDEVYGSLGPKDKPFSETTPYCPNSPYSASKAGADHLTRAWHHTYGLPTITTNCSNNYGPRQYPEKLIPLLIARALASQPLPIYGDGKNIRDWLFVEDHCEAIWLALERGRAGETYNIGGSCELTNIDVVERLCAELEVIRPRAGGKPYRDLITFVPDRPGHDRRYAIDSSKISAELGWRPAHSFSAGLRATIEWYLANPSWLAAVTRGEYAAWIARQYSSLKGVS